jgi:acyl-CoA synthetase (NDP forming)
VPVAAQPRVTVGRVLAFTWVASRASAASATSPAYATTCAVVGCSGGSGAPTSRNMLAVSGGIRRAVIGCQRRTKVSCAASPSCTADVTLAGPVEDLLLVLTRRLPADRVTITGDHALAEHWLARTAA